MDGFECMVAKRTIRTRVHISQCTMLCVGVIKKRIVEIEIDESDPTGGSLVAVT